MKLTKLFRGLETRDAKVDAENRTIQFPFSSEMPVQRFFGDEILSHETSAIDLARADAGAMPYLFNHNPDDLRGIVEKVWHDGKRLWAQVRVAKTAGGDELLGLIRDGMLPNVSFGYKIDEMLMTKAGDSTKGEMPTYTVTRWMPFEVSAVTIPADFKVGLGRSDLGDEFEVKVTNLEEKREVIEMPEKIEIDQNQERQKILADERKRTSEVLALGEKFGVQELARELLNSDKSLDECRTAVLEKISIRSAVITGKETDLGLSEKEKRQYSFMRALRVLANPEDASVRKEAAFELEVSIQGAKKRGKEASGIFVPYEILRRDLSKGSPTAGGYLVGTDHRPDMFIELLRKKSALDRAGATVLTGLVGDLAIPNQSGGATAYWVAEGSNITESAQTFGQVAMAPKTVGATTDVSRKLLLQSAPSIEQLIQSDLAKVTALAVDYAGIYGSGNAGQPLGIWNVAGNLNTKDFASANSPTFPELVSMESLVAADDADVDSMSYIVGAAMRGYMKSTVKFSSTAPTIWEPGNMVNGYRAITSNQMQAGDVLFGNFADLLIGYWSGLDLNVDRSALALSGGLRLIVLQDVDVAVRHAESFCIGDENQ